jgi:hypothetical protein
MVAAPVVNCATNERTCVHRVVDHVVDRIFDRIAEWAAHRTMVDHQQAAVADKTAAVVVERKMMVVERTMVVVEQKMVVVEHKMVAVEHKMVAVEHKMVAVERKMIERWTMVATTHIEVVVGTLMTVVRSVANGNVVEDVAVVRNFGVVEH